MPAAFPSHQFLLALLSAAPLFAADTAVPPAAGAVEPLRYGSVSVYSENDKYFSGSDKYYTNGAKISALSAPLSNFTGAEVPAPVRWVATNLSALIPPGHECKLGLSLGQNIYTPINIHTPTPDPTDRPYAAWLYLGALFQSYTLASPGWGGGDQLDSFEINLGMVGPAALGEQIQNGVHSALRIPHAQGWAHQIHNEPGLDLIYERKWRYETVGAHTGLGADLIPHAGLTLGNVFTYANAGLETRVGWKLPGDFGTDLIRPSSDSSDSKNIRPGFSIFLFGAVEGRAVARDLTLQGNTFGDSPSVTVDHFVSDLSFGLGCGTRHWQFTYSQANRSREFVGQPKPDNFGSVSITFFY